ncbi:uncharacterized protein LOC106779933 [Vigna radiata var. radiata]|uniref:Uncharacterized protein LOC106779933 n=1 Tax=Vigna radiata var. radiata TaxID=3916 RepID=A0A1S3VZ53_VIGRR|nr:uncharacterized protein LOC106779933 [Vigna radiata var. radiata]
MFTDQFAACRPQDTTLVDLMNMKQGKEEALRTFMERFTKAVRRVRGLSVEMALQYVMPALRPGPFKESVCRNPPKTLEELRQRAADEARVEEMKQNYRREMQEAKDKSEGKQGQSQRPTGAKGRDGPRVPRFPQYTPLNAPWARILQEALSTQIMRAPQKRPTPPGVDSGKHCLYHQNMGHDTEDCMTLKDRIEELIQAGHLKQYIRNHQNETVSAGRPSPRERSPRTSTDRGRRDVRPRYPREHDERGRNSERRRERSRSRSRSRAGGNGGPLRGMINTISGGFAGGGTSSSARKRSIRHLRSIHAVDVPRRTMPPIMFSDEDFHAPDPEQDDPMVITVEITRYGVSKVLVDQGSSVNILYWKTFRQMDISEDLIVPYDEQLVGFAGERVDTRGYLDLWTKIGAGREGEEKKVRYLLVDANTSYNVLLGRPCLNSFGAIVSTPHLTMKYPTSRGTICTIRADQKVARECYAAGLKMYPRETRRRTGGASVAMADLDPRTNTEDRLEPQGETQPMIVGTNPDQVTFIAQGLEEEMERQLRAALWRNRDLFAWTAADMPGIHPSIMAHRLSLFREARPIAQKKRKMGEEKRRAVQEEVRKLQTAGFIREVTYTTWLANVVMVKKSNGQWRMCTDYTDLNKACPKDSYPLPSIDVLVDRASEHQILSFLDAYSGYNQIPMHNPDREKTTFMADQANFCYEVMPFGLKNAGATYQRLMNKIFTDQIGRCLDVYVDDMVVRSDEGAQHLRDLEEVFRQVRRYGMRLNPAKCTFGVAAGKFLGFMLTSREIEANPDKCRAVLEMQTPRTVKEVQRLVGRLTALSRFVPKLAERAAPILKKMKKASANSWDDDCETAFQAIKGVLTQPPIMNRPSPGEDLQVYLGLSETVVSAVLLQEKPTPKLIYFVSRTLTDVETRYQQVEKVALALLHASRRLRQYFQSHQVVVRTDHPVSRILRKPDLAGRMVGWAVELSEFGIRYEPRGSVKGQHLADFAAEIPMIGHEEWLLYVDGASGRTVSGAGVVLEGPNGFLIEHSLIFKFKTSNNQAEYEALLAGLQLAKDMGARRVICRTDSQLVVGQMNGDFQVREDHLLKYYHQACSLVKEFDEVKIEHIPREQNAQADLLSKLSTGKEKGQLTTVIRQVLLQPSVECLATSASDTADWRTEIRNLIRKQDRGESLRPADSKRVARFMIIGNDLYRRGFSSPLLKCLAENEAQYVMSELHLGVCGFHTGGRALKAKTLRAGYYWPTMEADAVEFTRRGNQCQAHANNHHTPSQKLHTIVSPWPFAQWGMDIVGPFPPATGQRKFLLVAIDYFTKWVEAEPLATITASQVQKFCWKLICRFGLPRTVVTDNGRQFVDRRLETFFRGLGIKHATSSVEHPQTNGQAEAVNKTIVAELKRRLGDKKGAWADHLPEVLWAYRCTPHGTTRETPFNLTYGTDAMLPVELGEPSLRRNIENLQINDQELRVELDTIDERHDRAVLRAEACRRMVERKYNTKVRPRQFHEGDLVWRKAGEARRVAAHGKLAAKWEGPFKVVEALGNGAYRLTRLDGRQITNTWNASHLKLYFS